MIKHIKTNLLSLIFCIGTTLLLCSCNKQESIKEIYLIHGINATDVELHTILDLKNDLEKVVTEKVNILSEKEPLPANGIFYVIGTQKTNGLLSKSNLDTQNTLSVENPGPRGGIWSKITIGKSQEAIMLGGSDVQGMQYVVYDYSKEILGIDPLEYWTGKEPGQIDPLELFNFEDRIISPPKVPILCYFENDVDELANYRGKLLEYDWESYTEMINSLVRLRYNAIEFFDMLGRPEFFLRPEYQKLNPDYKIDLNYLDKMMDYAHLKGMKIQANFQFGYQIYPFPSDKADCWSTYKEDWITGWKYYLEKTPLAKTDIFSLRPRNQVWDWEYKSSCGEDKINVFNDVYKVFGELIDEYKPNAKKVLICYSDGMQMWNDGFRPPKDWVVAWSDDGFADFEYYPNNTSEFNFGTYMHAGFWLNHTVHNPYPEQIESAMKSMFKDYDADSYCMVNGQNFRPFLLNLEAFSEVCYDAESFKSENFYTEWTSRYFGEEASEYAIKSMKYLHKAQEERIGYVQHLWEIREAIAYLSNSPIERPGKTPVPFAYERVKNDFKHVANTHKYIDSALVAADKGLKAITNKDFYHSYIYLPALLYSDLITFETNLHKMAMLKQEFENSGNPEFLNKATLLLDKTKLDLKTMYTNRTTGDTNIKWDNWYDPTIRRPNNGFPTEEMLDKIALNLNTLSKK